MSAPEDQGFGKPCGQVQLEQLVKDAKDDQGKGDANRQGDTNGPFN
jgi:hypothetical protein